jgi:phage terminase Nu1 subunit (DNA packaging protein)
MAGRPRTRTATPEVSTSDMCEFFSVTRKTIAEWTKAGMPKVAEGAYHLKACFDWWCENINKDNDDETLTAAKRKYWTAKAEEADVKVKIARGKLISLEEVLDQWCKRVAEVKQGLLSLPVRFPPVLEGKTMKEMKVVISAEITRILDGYSREGKFCHGATKPARPPAKKKASSKKRKKR